MRRKIIGLFLLSFLTMSCSTNTEQKRDAAIETQQSATADYLLKRHIAQTETSNPEIAKELREIEKLRPRSKEIENTITGFLLKKHIQVMNGWYINEKCDFLSPELKSEWQSTIARNEKSLQEFNISPANFVKIKDVLQPVLKNTECTDKHRDMVVDAFADARKMRENFIDLDVKKAQYAPSLTNKK